GLALSLHDALPIWGLRCVSEPERVRRDQHQEDEPSEQQRKPEKQPPGRGLLEVLHDLAPSSEEDVPPRCNPIKSRACPQRKFDSVMGVTQTSYLRQGQARG